MATTTLRYDLRVGESIRFDRGRIVVTLEDKSGRLARLVIEADQGVVVDAPRRRDVVKQAQQGVIVKR